MISQIIVPDLGATGGEVTFAYWLVSAGDEIRSGQPLFLVETDKAVVEVEAFRDGIVRQLLVQPGDAVPVGGVVALVADSLTEMLPTSLSDSGQFPSSSEMDRRPPAVHSPTIQPGPRSADSQEIFSGSPGGSAAGRVLVTPAARRMAETSGVNLMDVNGTGRQGQILKRDVTRFLITHRPAGEKSRESHREPLSRMQKSIAQRSVESKGRIPHFYASITIDMAKALSLHRQMGETAAKVGWPVPSMNDFFLLSTARMLGSFPSLNASLESADLFYHRSINIGFVVGLENGGMLVPVVHNANRHNLFTLADATFSLKERAEKGILSSLELGGGTFTVTNLGMYGLNSFTAIINPPQTGILALGSVLERPAVYKGTVAARPLLEATLSVDHRLVDGITAARFLVALKQLVEEPLPLAVEPAREIGL